MKWKSTRDERGQAAIMAVLFFTFLLGFVGFATDVGGFLYAKRNLQIAADAAAIAGAKEIRIDSTKIVSAGKAASAQNGVTNGVNGASVAVNAPPLGGPHAGDASYVEAIVRKPQRTFFIGLLGFASMPVAARAVAFNGAQNDIQCIRANNATGAGTINLQGSFTVDAPGCSVIDNSRDPAAMSFTGNGGSLTAGFVGVVGGTGGNHIDSTPQPTLGIPQTSDPLAGVITPPTYNAASCTAAPTAGKKATTVTWGSAAGGITCYSGDVVVGKNITVTMDPGMYVFTGTLDFSGGGTLNGTGVTIYIPPGGTLGGGGNGNTTLNLTAPTSGAYSGVVMYQNASNTNTISFNGTPIVGLTGIVYAPGAELDLSGNTTMNLTTDLIVGSLFDKGNATINITDYTQKFGGPLTTIALVE
jgi:hypothetical protein